PGGFGVAPDGSFDPGEPAKLAGELAGRGVSIINVTMGNPYFNPHVNRPFSAGAYDPPESPLDGVARLLSGAEIINQAAPSAAVVASGFSFLGAAAPHVAAACAASGSFDLCGFGRAAIAYPGLASDILLDGEMKKEKLCLCCSKCTERMRKPGGTPGCVVRDAEKYLPIYRKFCVED
ncbi:MAG: flavin oxidoreductase/NADH oxidase, partial [Clostridia bacterium]|nr:flavin oxidoreductase/NADH oxidase [Clostridia bacterium]